MNGRRRAAAIILRDRRVLMVHERSRREGSREWWTLPGGGIDPGETPEDAVRREVLEEVGLVVKEARYVQDVQYPSGLTSVFLCTVGDEEPQLGPHLGGPEPVGIDWVPLPDLKPGDPTLVAVPPMIVAFPLPE
ncbi:NUDIX domain-containing protein [Symbioplanes lichenis]|uniref:NUDIX domain-containing protein n=1 Tax=Symbioplanes lichenis TaxID=1629072 RepID=UPI0027389E4C|nr:NUDIX hydrolase [Actinoplanes lichenis]